MNRRQAIIRSAASFGGAILHTAMANWKMNTIESKEEIPFGVQLFTIPSLIDKDLKGTLKIIADIGYKNVEFFGPYPFSNEETKKQWNGFKQQMGLANNAFYGFTVDETGAMLKEYGLETPSFHTDLLTLRHNLDVVLDELSKLNARYLVLPAIFESRETLSDYQRFAEEFNKIGERMSSYGMQFVYHNHGYEHAPKDGKVPMDLLIQETDPEYVQFELDIFWMQAAGADPIDYLRKYPERYKMLHLKDASEAFRFSGDGGSPDQWMAGFSKMSDPGDGVYDIKGIIAEAVKTGVECYFLERDLAPEPMKTLTNSFQNLTQLSK